VAIAEQFLDLWRQRLDNSELTAGCAVLAVPVAGPDVDLLDHTRPFFEIGQSIRQDCSLLWEGPRLRVSNSRR
jgi:hypothetical protein